MNPYRKRETQFPVLAAAAAGTTSDVQTLLDSGTPLSVDGVFGETPLHWAAARGDLEMVRLLLNAGLYASSVDHHGDRPVDVAQRFGHAECHQLLEAEQRRESQQPANFKAKVKRNQPVDPLQR